MSQTRKKVQAVGSTKRFDPQVLRRDLDAGKEIYLLDVRRTEELEQIGTIEGYHHIPMGQLAMRMAEIPKSKPLVVF